jgi:glycosyltransferase involved in cell wall biosynthesis
MREPITVIIPCRPQDMPLETIETLFQQTYQKLVLITVIDWDNRGQSWARNKGLSLAKTRYVLFSDYDCRWVPDAVETLYEALTAASPGNQLIDNGNHSLVGYSYGGYHQLRAGVPEMTFGLEPWNWRRLCSGNYISTMSLIHTTLLGMRGCLGFDESLRRLEDWDLWLRCGQKDIAGVGVNKILFTTEIKPGVSHGGPVSHAEAEVMVRQRRGL